MLYIPIYIYFKAQSDLKYNVYKKQDLPILHKHLDSSPFFCRVKVEHLYSFLCCVFYFVSFRSVSCSQMSLVS